MDDKWCAGKINKVVHFNCFFSTWTFSSSFFFLKKRLNLYFAISFGALRARLWGFWSDIHLRFEVFAQFTPNKLFIYMALKWNDHKPVVIILNEGDHKKAMQYNWRGISNKYVICIQWLFLFELGNFEEIEHFFFISVMMTIIISNTRKRKKKSFEYGNLFAYQDLVHWAHYISGK